MASAAVCAGGSCPDLHDEASLVQMKSALQFGSKRGVKDEVKRNTTAKVWPFSCDPAEDCTCDDSCCRKADCSDCSNSRLYESAIMENFPYSDAQCCHSPDDCTMYEKRYQWQQEEQRRNAPEPETARFRKPTPAEARYARRLHAEAKSKADQEDIERSKAARYARNRPGYRTHAQVQQAHQARSGDETDARRERMRQQMAARRAER